MFDRLALAVGRDALRRDPAGGIRAAPSSIDALAHLMGVAHDAAIHVAIAGAGTWQDDGAPADLRISLRSLDLISRFDPEEAALTAQGGTSVERLRREALEHGMWLPVDAPGRADRTIGSVLATATTGPLRHSVGAMRQHVASITVVGGDGRIHRLDAADASADPALQVAPHLGAFGGFGVIVDASLRLRELPQADVTWMAISDRDRLTGLARDLARRSIGAAAIEMFSPALAAEPDWVLGVRVIGTQETVAAAGRLLADTGSVEWHELPPEKRALLWSETSRAVTSAPVTIRLGVLPEGIDETIDLVVARLGEGLLSAGPATGSIRWSGTADHAVVGPLRTALATREIPLTLERGPWELRRRIGHVGAYREGARESVSGLREAFDPRHVIVAPLEAS